MILFTANDCTSCIPVKKALANIRHEVINLDSDEGLTVARNLGIRGVPTIVQNNLVTTGQQQCLDLIGEHNE